MVDAPLFKDLVLVERLGGLTVPQARMAAREALAERDAAMEPPAAVRLPAVGSEKIVRVIEKLIKAIEQEGDPENRRKQPIMSA